MNSTPETPKTETPPPDDANTKGTIIMTFVCLAVMCFGLSAILGVLLPGWSSAIRDEPVKPRDMGIFFICAGATLVVLLNCQIIHFALVRSAKRRLALASVLIIAAISIGLFGYEYRTTRWKVERLAQAGSDSPKPLGPIFSRTQITIISILIFLSIPQFLPKKSKDDSRPQS